jgi:cyclic pyranopterin phosphate synthase
MPLDKVDVDIHLEEEGAVAVVRCECSVCHRTGVEMEALTGATIAALTIYDMVKAISHRVRIQDTVLVKKTGGRRSIDEG